MLSEWGHTYSRHFWHNLYSPLCPNNSLLGKRGKRWGYDPQGTVLRHLQVWWKQLLSEGFPVVLQPKRCQPVHVHSSCVSVLMWTWTYLCLDFKMVEFHFIPKINKNSPYHCCSCQTWMCSAACLSLKTTSRYLQGNKVYPQFDVIAAMPWHSFWSLY